MSSSASRLLSPIREFISDSRAVGIVLLISTVVSLAVANSGWGPGYIRFWNGELNMPMSGIHLPHTPLHAINDALMALFFLLVGLEIKRELLCGELADRRQAMLPVLGAIGGMALPAGIYYLICAGTPDVRGWGIPMATDIAFSLGVLSLLGDRIPLSVRIFLTALAIVDDLGGILAIALFYSDGIQWSYLGAAGGVLAILIVLNRLRVSQHWAYLALGIPLWYFVYNSGIHPTIAGVALAFCIPIRKIGNLEHALHDPVSFLILPVFALANTAFLLPTDWNGVLTSRVQYGVLSGLLIGKPLGIAGITWLAKRIGWVTLPEGFRSRHLIGAGIMAGIGFTMSLFMTALAFQTSEQQDMAKIGILAGSALSGLIGYLWLRRTPASPVAPEPPVS